MLCEINILSLSQALEKRLQKERAITQELHKQLVEREEDLETLSKSVQQVGPDLTVYRTSLSKCAFTLHQFCASFWFSLRL